MKILYKIFLLCFCVIQANGQNNYTQILKGSIIDKDVKYPLIGATVKVYREQQLIAGGKSNEFGEYKIDSLPLQRYTIVCTYVGYSERTIENVELNSGKETQLNIELSTSSTKMKAVVVQNKKGSINNEMANISARNFNPEAASRYVASRDDIARMATNFAGVRGSDDSRNDIVIRGNSPNGVLWRVEGLDISNPNHFASFGTTGGPVNIINNKLLGNSDFMTGAFPADYGNGISGVFDLKLRNGNKDKHEFTAQIGILGLEATAEGPIHRKSGASYTFSYRYATLAIMNKFGINFGADGNPSYQDVNFKLNFPIKKIGNFSLFGIGGKSDISIYDNGDDSSKWTYGRAGRDIHFGSRLGVVGAAMQQNIGKIFYHKLTLGTNLSKSYSRYDTVGNDNISRGATYRNQFIVNKLMLNYIATARITHQQTVKAGFTLTGMDLNLVDSNYYPDQQIWYNEAEFRDQTSMVQAFAAWQFKPNESLKINAGIHYLRFILNQSQSIEPRAGISWNVHPKLQLNAGYGLHSNLQPYYIYFLQQPDGSGNNYQPNLQTGLSKSHHFIIGGDYTLNPTMHIKVETYYQHLFNLPQEVKGSAYSSLNQGASFNFTFPDPLNNKGKGYNAGVDITLEKFFSKYFYYLITTSIYTSKYKSSDNVWRNTDFNGAYNLNVLAGKEFTLGKAKTTRLVGGFKFNLSGGKWYTPIDSALSAQKKQYEGIDAETNTLQFAPYHRLDIRVGFKVNRKRYHHQFSLDLINVYNQKNTLGLSYIPKTGEVVKESNLGFLPLFNWLVVF
ncbi:MAG: TonB-dependent receptor [Bacteroidetes bacterium]|nr:TonB-dependent receptor [Bacteroidota bacterium]